MVSNFVLVASALARCHAQSFDEWRAAIGKDYSSSHEQAYRQQVFDANQVFVVGHNTRFDVGLETYSVALNHFADLTLEEFQAAYANTVLGVRREKLASVADPSLSLASQSLPDSMDWRQQGAVTSIKNQGQCGSCWAFSTTGALEAAHFRATGELVALSEQELIECDDRSGGLDDGCNGGDMVTAFGWIQSNGGLCAEALYPYRDETGFNGTWRACEDGACQKRANVDSIVELESNNEAAIKTAVGTVGPVSIALEADVQGFQFYKSGIFAASCGASPNHGMLVIGYGDAPVQALELADAPAECSAHPTCVSQGWDGQCCPKRPNDFLKCCDTPVPGTNMSYWLLKNSWTTRWGEEGFMRIRRDVSARSGMCGLAISPSYPVAAQPSPTSPVPNSYQVGSALVV